MTFANRMNRIALGDTVYRTAQKMGNRVASIDGSIRTTYRELDHFSSQLAHYLLASGLQSGDKVAMINQNSTQFLIATYGILKAGMVWVPINTMLNGEDTHYILQHSEAKLVLIDNQLHTPPLQQLLHTLNIPYLVIKLPTDKIGHEPDLLQAIHEQPTYLPDIFIQDHDLALIMYTSGTTDRPKGVMHSHRSILTALMSNIAEFSLQTDDVASVILPLFHCAQFSTAAALLIMGGSIVIQRGFNADTLLDTIANEKSLNYLSYPLCITLYIRIPNGLR